MTLYIGALPLLPALYSFDPQVLPIVYDCPACDISDTSLLSCPRNAGELQGGDQIVGGELGVLVGATLGVDALKGVVGVLCEGTYVTL